MKRLALIAGILLLLFGIAGFAGLYAANVTHAAIYAVVGVIGIMVGLSHRRQLVPPGSRGPDMRDVV